LFHHFSRHSDEQNFRCFLFGICISGLPQARHTPDEELPVNSLLRQKDFTVFTDMPTVHQKSTM